MVRTDLEAQMLEKLVVFENEVRLLASDYFREMHSIVVVGELGDLILVQKQNRPFPPLGRYLCFKTSRLLE